MAIWQVTMELIPLSWAEKHQYDSNSLYDANGLYDVSNAWENNQPTVDFGEIISTFLPAKGSWDTELDIWGKAENDDVQVWREEGLVESIGCRIDLRKDTTKITEELMSFAKTMKCVLFFPEQKKIVKPEVTSTIQVIRNSGAAKFVQDPEEYLDSIGST